MSVSWGGGQTGAAFGRVALRWLWSRCVSGLVGGPKRVSGCLQEGKGGCGGSTAWFGLAGWGSNGCGWAGGVVSGGLGVGGGGRA